MQQGGPWREYTSKHFIVDTDAPEARAARLIAALEKLRALELQTLLGEQAEIPGRLRVLAPKSRGQFFDLAGGTLGGFFMQDGVFGDPAMLAPVEGMDEDPELLAHELAHAISLHLFPQQPRWFAEGLAGFVQTLGAPPKEGEMPVGSHMVHGRSPAHAAGAVPRWFGRFTAAYGQAVSARQVLLWKGAEDRDVPGAYHVWSWMLYHWLWNTRGQPFAAYQKRLSEGEEPAAAWKAAFPDLDPDDAGAMRDLDGALKSYRERGRFAMWTIEVESDAAYAESAFSSADLHLWLLAMRLRWPDEKEARSALVRDQVTEALREDPLSAASAGWNTGDGFKPPPVGDLRGLVRQRPAEWRNWLTLATYSPDPAEKEAALRKAVALNDANARAQNELAWLLVTSGRAREALPFANRALDLAPWNPSIVDTLAEVAAQLGKCPQALVLDRRAVRMAESRGRKSESLRTRLGEMEKRCAGKEP